MDHDTRSDRVVARAPAGAYPDGIAFDRADGRVFVADELGGALAVFDVHGRRIGTVRLGGQAGNVQYDPVRGRLLVSVQTRNELAVVDPATLRITRRSALRGCGRPHGLALDPAGAVAFVACAGDAALVTLDLRSSRVGSTAAVGRGPDVVALDAERKRVYVAAESGDLAVLAETARRARKLGESFVGAAAQSVAADSRTHLVYIPLPAAAGRPPEIQVDSPTAAPPPKSPVPSGEPLQTYPGSQPAGGPWRELARASTPRRGAPVLVRGFVESPSGLAFSLSASTAEPVQVFWSSYCEGYENDTYFNHAGTLVGPQPFVAYPPVLTGAAKCVLTLRLMPASDATAEAVIFSS